MRVVSALVCMFHYADLENAGASAAPWSSQPPWVDVVLVASVVSYSLRSHGL